MANLKNVRIWVSQDLIDQLRVKYQYETKNMTDDTMINYLLSNLVLIDQTTQE